MSLHLAFQHLQAIGAIKALPFTDQVAAVSCGIHGGQEVLDLDYAEASTAAAVDNFVLTAAGGLVGAQGTAHDVPFSRPAFVAPLNLAVKAGNVRCALPQIGAGTTRASRNPHK